MKVQVTRHKDGAVKEVFYDEYENSPKCLMHMRLQPPGILVGRDKSYGIHPAMSMLINSDVPDWANRLRVAFATVIQPYDHTSVARMLAKIGHAYACAELGPNAFNHLLPDVILKRVDWLYNHLVGGDYVVDAPHSPLPKLGLLHALDLTTESAVSGEVFYVVKIRLFANEDSPVYRVVVGRPLESR